MDEGLEDGGVDVEELGLVARRCDAGERLSLGRGRATLEDGAGTRAVCGRHRGCGARVVRQVDCVGCKLGYMKVAVQSVR